MAKLSPVPFVTFYSFCPTIINKLHPCFRGSFIHNLKYFIFEPRIETWNSTELSFIDSTFIQIWFFYFPLLWNHYLTVFCYNDH